MDTCCWVNWGVGTDVPEARLSYYQYHSFVVRQFRFVWLCVSLKSRSLHHHRCPAPCCLLQLFYKFCDIFPTYDYFLKMLQQTVPFSDRQMLARCP